MFLVNSRYSHFSAALFSSTSKLLHLTRAPLLPKLRGKLAEFLNEDSLKRLRILSSPTCVGLRYNHQINSLRGFSWWHGINQFVLEIEILITSRCYTRGRICLPSPPNGLNQDIHHLDDLPFHVPPSLKRLSGGTGILTCFPSPTLFSLGLGID